MNSYSTMNTHKSHDTSRQSNYEPPEPKEVPLLNILKKLHKDRVQNGQDDYQAPNNFMNISNEIKFNYLSQYPKQT